MAFIFLFLFANRFSSSSVVLPNSVDAELVQGPDSKSHGTEDNKVINVNIWSLTQITIKGAKKAAGSSMLWQIYIELHYITHGNFYEALCSGPNFKG